MPRPTTAPAPTATIVEERLRPDQAAKRVGVTRWTIYTWINEGVSDGAGGTVRLGPVERVGTRCTLIRASVLEAFLTRFQLGSQS